MDLNQYILALKARRKAFVTVLAVTIFTAIVAALVIPKRYDASATILIDARDEQTMAPARMSPRERAGYIFTQMELIASGKVAHKVVRDLKLASQPGVREEWERDTGGAGTIEEWLATNLLEKLKVDSGASNILIVKYSANDAKKAAEIANAFAKAYLDVALELRTEPSREAGQWFDEQVKALRADVTSAQTKLSAYQKEKGVVGGDDRMDVEFTRLAELNAELGRQKAATLDAQTRYKQAQELIAGGVSLEAFPEVLANGYIITVKSALQAAEGRLQEQSEVLGPNHPTYQRTAAEVQGLKERLTSEATKVVTGLGNAVQQSSKRVEELQSALKDQSDRIMKMRESRVDMAVLSRDLDNAQRAYDGALSRAIAVKVDSKVRQTNLAMLTPAVEPLKPAVPKVGLISALSVLIGLLLAAGIVYVLELLDRRVRSRTDLESRLAVPSLGILSRWTPAGGRLLPSPNSPARAALPRPW
ncbi:MAG: chain length determinant protein EpsF [Betaproteobacteria bacterium]|nr:MAG: chain length determinant protein EpsF [Betaproteobacteria bacterium]